MAGLFDQLLAAITATQDPRAYAQQTAFDPSYQPGVAPSFDGGAPAAPQPAPAPRPVPIPTPRPEMYFAPMPVPQDDPASQTRANPAPAPVTNPRPSGPNGQGYEPMPRDAIPNGAAVLAGMAPHGVGGVGGGKSSETPVMTGGVGTDQLTGGAGGAQSGGNPISQLLGGLGLGGGAGGGTSPLSYTLQGWAMGRTPQESLAYGGRMAQYGRQQAQEQRTFLAKAQWLMQNGVQPGEAQYLASDKDAFNAYYKDAKAGQKWDPVIVQGQDGQTYMFDKNTQRGQPIDMQKIGGQKAPDAPTVQTQYDAKGNEQKVQWQNGQWVPMGGAKSSVLSPEEEAQKIRLAQAARAQTNINIGERLPPGYRWIDEGDQKKGVEPIPGGPETKIPAEQAARTAIGDSFLGQVPDMRKAIDAGKITGLYDRFKAGNIDKSEAADIFRKWESGVDALQRQLSGAGMPVQEAQNYARRYLPSYTDSKESARAKLDQLEREIAASRNIVGRGRGGDAMPSAAPQAEPKANDPLGIR